MSAPPASWLATLARRSPLVLAPDGARGWFGGRSIVAFDPVDGGVISGNGPEALHAAGAVLERALNAREPLVAVALLPYSGDTRWALYPRGAELTPHGWRWWGSESDGGWPELPAASPAPAAESAPPAPALLPPLAAPVRSSLDAPAFRSAVEATREAIMRGDVYVLNLTRTIEGRTALSAPELFAALTARTPASMAAAWLPDDGGRAIVSASPERFVRLTGHEAEIAPVKGTRPRGSDAVADAALVADLLGDAKERAEHVMIVDLERNDLGRVCVPGSVRVDPLFEVETTSYCHQAVSSVRGLLRDDASIGDLFEATFPCGSITGAPKIAAMRIIGELERGERSAYTGSLVVAMPGELDSSVLIRTAELNPDTGALSYGAGCGITVDSGPEAEWEESVLKASPLFGGDAPPARTPAPLGPPVALKETCRVAGGTVPLWPFHRARLANGGCPPALLDAIEARVSAAAAEWAGAPTRRARLTVVASLDGSFAVDVDQRLSSLDVPGGLLVARVDLDAPPPIPADPAKPADRSYWDAAHHAAERAHAHQAVLVDTDGMVVDGSTSAVWIAENGVLVTPPAPPAIPSVSVAFVRANAERAGLQVRVEPISWLRFESADEAFFTNAFGGAAPWPSRSAVLGGEGSVRRGVASLAGAGHAHNDGTFASSQQIESLGRSGLSIRCGAA